MARLIGGAILISCLGPIAALLVFCLWKGFF
jgi:hypothetical protein